MIGWMVAIIMPSLGWLVGHILSGQPGFRPTMGTLPLVGALAPAGLQRWCGRTPLEQVLGWGLGFLGWAAAAIGHDGEFLAATFLGGAAWGLVLGASKLGEVSTTSPQATPAVKAAPSDPPRMPPPARETPPLPPRRTAPAGDVSEEDLGFRLALRCPTCGAELAVPVYHHMTRCEFCASEHVVHGRGSHPRGHSRRRDVPRGGPCGCRQISATLTLPEALPTEGATPGRAAPGTTGAERRALPH